MDEESLSYVAHLLREGAASGERKGARTRRALRVATIRMLDEVGYHQMRQSDICARAGISSATFYFHYKDKEEITLSVLNDFIRFMEGRIVARADTPRDLFEAMCLANARWVRSVRENIGLMRCLLQISDQVPEFAELYQDVNHRFHAAVARNILKRTDGEEGDMPILTLLAYALGSMMDEIARRLLIAGSRPLGAVVSTSVSSDEELAEVLTLIWYRAIYVTNPPHVRADGAQKLVKLSRRPPA